MTRRLSSLLPFLGLFLLPCLLLWPIVFRGEAFVPADLLRDLAPWRSSPPAAQVPWNPLLWDSVAEFYPWRSFYAATVKSGYLPLWNPHQFCGTPFVANSQSAVFYPPNLLFCLLPVAQAFGVSVLLHLVLTGFFAYAFLHRGSLRLGRAASLLGAAAWQICHWQVAWLALPTFLCVSAWLPLALLLADRAVEKPTAARAAGLGLCLGLMLLGGHLQIALYCFGLITAYALFRLIPHLKTSWQPLLGCAVLASALAFSLAAPQLLPAVELAHSSHRAGAAATWDAYQGYTRLAMPPADLITLFLPGFFGSPTAGTYWAVLVRGLALNGGAGAYMENACYSGVLTLLLALAGLIMTWRQNPTTRFFAVTAAIALLLALGTPLNALLFFGIPGFAQTGSPGRILIVWAFCIPVLAAIGTQALLRSRHLQALGKAAACFALVGLLALGSAVFWVSVNAAAGTLGGNLGTETDLWRIPLGILLGAGAALWLWRRGSLKTPEIGGALAALTALDLLAAGYGFNRTTPPQNVYPVTPLIAYLQQHSGEGRVMPLNRKWSLYAPPPAVLPPNAATIYGLNDTQGYDSLLTGRYFQFAGALDGGSPAPPENGNMVFTDGYRSPEAQAASARFLLALQPLTRKNLKLVRQDNGVFLYEDGEALPRIRMTTTQSSFIVMPSPPTRLIAESRGKQKANEIVVADQWYPGWQGWVNGKRAAVTPEPYVFRTLRPASASQGMGEKVTVEMRYLPTAFRVGLYALCLGLGGAAAVAAAALMSRRTGR